MAEERSKEVVIVIDCPPIQPQSWCQNICQRWSDCSMQQSQCCYVHASNLLCLCILSFFYCLI